MATIIIADDPISFDTEVVHADRPVVVEFWAPWCGPCRLVAPELQALADFHADSIKVVKVNVDANTEIVASYGIQSVPTVTLFFDGQLMAESIGAKPRPEIEADLGLTPTWAAPGQPAPIRTRLAQDRPRN
jgi:thioredoxin 1